MSGETASYTALDYSWNEQISLLWGKKVQGISYNELISENVTARYKRDPA